MRSLLVEVYELGVKRSDDHRSHRMRRARHGLAREMLHLMRERAAEST